MTKYVKVTLCEFNNMRAAVISGLIQSGCWDNDEQEEEIRVAAKATRAIELRNGVEEQIDWSEFVD